MEVFMNFINAMFGSILSLDPVSAVKMVVMWATSGFHFLGYFPFPPLI